MSGATATNPRGRTRNPRGEGARLGEELVTAASEMSAKTGDASQLSLRGVARAVGIAAPSIYRHFPDLDHLKLAVVERAVQRFAETRDHASVETDDPAEALLARCRAYCRFALANPGPYRFMFSHQAPKGSAVAMAAFHALADSIAQCQQNRLTLAPDRPEHLAAQVWAALHGLVILRLNSPEFPWPAPLEQMADDAVTRLVGLTDRPLADQAQNDQTPRPGSEQPMTTAAAPSNSKGSLARAAAAIAAALVPVLAGLAILCSHRARRAAIALIGADHAASAPAAQLGKLWGIGLIIIGALQALGSLALGSSITDPAAVLLRTLFALLAEALLYLITTRITPRHAPAG